MKLSSNSLQAADPLAWVYLNNFVSENQRPLEYSDHRFMIDPMQDMSPDQVWRKSAQLGGSVAVILKSFHGANFRGQNIGYILPSQNIVKDFVVPKVDPLIQSNPIIEKMVTKDSVTLKQVGDRFVYFRGAYSEREAIAISLDVLVLDELDRMPNMNVVNIYDSRLQASKWGWRWRLSNPSVPDFGIDTLFGESDSKHWFVKCSHCNHTFYLDWEESDEKNHFIDQDRRMYICGKCGGEITDDDRRRGQWVAAFPGKEISGYWMSQLIVPYISAKRIVEQFKESETGFFYNFVLGKAYQQADMNLDREVIVRNLSPSSVVEHSICMGVDVGKKKHVVIGTPTGVIKTASVDEWEDVEYLINKYDATCVIDGAPEFTIPQQLTRKYPGKVFMAYYVTDKKNMGIIRWLEGADRGVVHIDRTKAFDFVVQEITANKFKYYLPLEELEEYIYHWKNIYRVVELNRLGVHQAKWLTTENKPDHFAHAHLYYRTAMEKVFGAIGPGVVETDLAEEKEAGVLSNVVEDEM